MKTYEYLVEYKYKTRWAPTTENALSIVVESSAEEAKKLIENNFKVERVLNVWVLGDKLLSAKQNEQS